MADSITQAQLATAIAKQVAQSSGESIGLKTLRRDLEVSFGLARRALDPRKDEIKELLLAAMNLAEQEQEPERGRARTGAGVGGAPRPAAETMVPWEEEPEEAKGKDRAGQTADFEGFLKKRGDQGRIKLWSKRYFKLYKNEGVIAYFKSDKDTKQLGEISVVGAFLIEKRDDVAKFAFTVTMKTTARVWWLQAKDEAQRQSWIDACTPLMKEEVQPAEGKRKKPPLGEPLRYPPTYVQGWSEIEDCKSIIQTTKHWAGLLPKARPQVELADGQVALTLHENSVAVVEEVRQVTLDDNKEGFITNLPKQLKHTAQSVQWSAKDSQLSQQRFFYDNKTQEELLKRLHGHEIEVTNRRKNAFGDDVKFKGKVAYHPEDRVNGEHHDMKNGQGHQFALVDESSNTVHFLNTKDAHSFNLLAVDRTKLSPGAEDVFAEPRLWGKFHSEASSSLGQLTYHLEDSFGLHTNYAITLNPNETAADVQGWFSIENKTGRTFHNATLGVVPGPPPKKSTGKSAEGDKSAAEAAADEAVDAGKETAKKGLGALAALAGGLMGKKKEDPPPPRKYHYPIEEAVTLPAYDWAHASFVHQNVSNKSQHLVRFDTPKFTIYPNVEESAGSDAAARIFTTVSFKNPLDAPLPAGPVRINRREATNHGARHLVTASLPRVEAGERVVLELEKLHGISVTRKQTGYNFDAEKKFIIESYEINVSNGRQELVHLNIEESMWRWNNYELTNSWPAFKPTENPRVIRWIVDLNHAEDVTIRYTVFYSTFELPGDWLEDESPSDEPAKK